MTDKFWAVVVCAVIIILGAAVHQDASTDAGRTSAVANQASPWRARCVYGQLVYIRDFNSNRSVAVNALRPNGTSIACGGK